MNKETSNYLALGGVTGPVLFTLMILISASYRPDYRYTQFISELGASGTPHASLINYLGFIPGGLMIIAFGVALIMKAKGPLSNIGSAFFILFGAGMFIAGIFSCDVGCPREGTMPNNIHDQVSGPAFMSAILGMLLRGISFRSLPYWSGLWLYSVVSAIIAIGFMIALVASLDAYTTTGLWQRLLLATIFIWCVLVGWKMYNMDAHPSDSLQPA